MYKTLSNFSVFCFRNKVLVWMLLAVSLLICLAFASCGDGDGSSPTAPSGGTSILFVDNFNDNSINTNDWSRVTSGVFEENGILKTRRDEVDRGGSIASRWIAFDNGKTLIIKRKANIHYANQYYDGHLTIYIDGAPNFTFGMSYAQYSYSVGDEMPKYGFFIFRNNANSHLESDQGDVSGMIQPVWDTWFDEKITYDPLTGVLEYFINGGKRLEYNVGILPTLSSYYLKLEFSNWGWWTGHYQYIDDVSVEQPK